MTTVLTAIITGVVVLLAGSVPWGGFSTLNLRIGTTVPWAILPMTVYLAAYWGFLSGRWGDPESAATRRANLRANRLSPAMWGRSLAAGSLGFAALLALLAFAARLVRLPATPPMVMPSAMPVITAFLLIVMQSIMAGVTEEAAFRGYMQSPIERHYGVIIAIVINGALFGLLHFSSHPNDVLLMLPYYIAVAAVYGGLTWATDSILPALVLHSFGDIVVLTRLWVTGRPEWQLFETPPSLVWERGIDVSFAITTTVFVVFAVCTTWSYVALWRLRERGMAMSSLARDTIPI